MPILQFRLHLKFLTTFITLSPVENDKRIQPRPRVHKFLE